MARGLAYLARGHYDHRRLCDGFVLSPSCCPIDLEKARAQGFDGAKGEHFRLSWSIGLDGNSSNLESLWVRLQDPHIDGLQHIVSDSVDDSARTPCCKGFEPCQRVDFLNTVGARPIGHRDLDAHRQQLSTQESQCLGHIGGRSLGPHDGYGSRVGGP